MSNAELLKQLRIDHAQRESHGGGNGLKIAIIVGMVVLVLAAGGGVAWWLLGDKALPVQTAQATAPTAQSGAGSVLQATGYITARRQATVSAQITGTLTEVLIEEGDRVKKGQILARLDDNGYRASLEATKASALAASAQASQVSAQLEQARRDVIRADALAQRGLVSKQSAEQQRATTDALVAQLRSAQRAADSAQSQVNVAQVNFDYTVVRAPFDGVITDKAAQVGEIVSPLSAGGGFTRTGVGTIVDMDSLEIDVDVNEAYIGRVKPDMAAEAILDAYPDWKIPAHVIAIVPAADRGKATVKVRVALESKDERIVPDMGVRVSFLDARPVQAAAPPKGVLVPAKAIVQRDGHDVVFVVADNRAHQHAVTPATLSYGELRLVPSAVNAGDTVVVSPADELRDGAAVEPAKTP